MSQKMLNNEMQSFVGETLSFDNLGNYKLLRAKQDLNLDKSLLHEVFFAPASSINKKSRCNFRFQIRVMCEHKVFNNRKGNSMIIDHRLCKWAILMVELRKR